MSDKFFAAKPINCFNFNLAHINDVGNMFNT